MAYCIGIEDGGAGCNGAARNAPARHGTEGMKGSTTKNTAPTMKTSRGIKATAAKTASGMKASASMETATHAAMEAATTASMETTAPTATMKTAPAPDTSRLGWACARHLHECARQGAYKCQRNPLGVHSSEHVFLHLN
jgi:hypothetical protein